MKASHRGTQGGAVEPGSAGETAEPRVRGSSSRRYSVPERKALLRELEASGETMAIFCARHAVSTATICKWRRALREHGEAGLTPREPRRNAMGRTGRVRSADERRAAVEAFDKSKMLMQDFARTYGVSLGTLRTWLTRYRTAGPKGLEPRRRGRKRGGGGTLSPAAIGVQTEIVRTKTRFPEFGLKKVRDFLRRFQGVHVSTGTVARTLERAGVERTPAPKKRRPKRALVRRFERSRPGELWQSDITSFHLTRHGTRVYLTVFLDDFSRFVVSFALATHQRQELVSEALMEGVSRFGKPKEVLTDQGRQYFAWRGKSDFQKLLVREGIEHVVSRTHHPETLGKCERLWETINREFWERARPQDVTDARERLAHWLAHYNYFRPHQGIDGLVPADRFFGAQEALRKTHESRLSQRELEAALEETPRRGVYLFGQIGDEQVSLSGERGELVLQTSSGVRQRIGLEELGAPSAAEKGSSDESEHGRGEGEHDRRSGSEGRELVATGATAAPPHGQEAAEVWPAAEVSPRSQGAVDERHGGGADPGAPGVHADPGFVAGEAAPRGGGFGALDPGPACVATEPASALGDARGSAPSTESAASARGDSDDREGRRPASLEEALGGAGQNDQRSTGPDPAPIESAQAAERAVGVERVDTGGENARPHSEGAG